MGVIAITGWDTSDNETTVDFAAVKEVNRLRDSAERELKNLMRVSRRAAPVTETERRAVAADCRYNAFFGNRKLRSKVCAGGDCLHTAYIAKREKRAAEGDEAVEKSTAALRIKLTDLVVAAGSDNVKIFEVPREWRQKIEDILNPPPLPLEQRVDEILKAIDDAADRREAAEAASPVAEAPVSIDAADVVEEPVAISAAVDDEYSAAAGVAAD